MYDLSWPAMVLEFFIIKCLSPLARSEQARWLGRSFSCTEKVSRFIYETIHPFEDSAKRLIESTLGA